MTSPPHTMIEAALFYARQGHTVFPVPPGEKKSFKSKKHSNGQNWGATSDTEQIRDDFLFKWPGANIGLPTGNGTGFFVVEADTVAGHGVDGLASLAALQEQNGPLPATRTARSPSGSMHYYFKTRDGVTIKNSASEIAQGVDVRGEGGMVLAPPSVKPHKGHYEWVNWGEIAEAPDWLIELCKLTPRQPKLAGVCAEAGEPIEQEKIAAAVAVIPNNDVGWEDWNRIAMAIYAAFEGSEAGYAAFQAWSQKSSKFEASHTEEKWQQLHACPPEEIGVGTLFFLADQAAPGWRTACARLVEPPPPEIAKLNEDYALVRVGDKVSVMDTTENEISFLTLDAFNEWLANRSVTHNEKKVPLAKYWRRHPQRRQYNGLVFSPKREVPGKFNLWRGFSVEPNPNGDCSLLLAHIHDNVCGGSTTFYDWTMGWFADIVQHPQEKKGTSVGLRGKQGTGKTIVGKYFRTLLPHHSVLANNPRLITGRFNAHLASCLFLHADEGFWAGDREAEGKLKDLITNDFQYIEFKGRELIRVANYMRLFVTGNAEWLVPAGFVERRFFVLEVGEAQMKNTKYFTAIKKEMDGGGPAALLHYLLDYDLSKVDLRTTPTTDALLSQQILTASAEQGWWLDVLHRGALPWGCDVAGECPVAALFNHYVRHAQKQGARRRSIETQLGMFLTRHVPGLTKADKVHKVPTRNGGSSEYRGYVYEFPTLTKCREEFAKAMQQTLVWDTTHTDWATLPAPPYDEDAPF